MLRSIGSVVCHTLIVVYGTHHRANLSSFLTVCVELLNLGKSNSNPQLRPLLVVNNITSERDFSFSNGLQDLSFYSLRNGVCLFRFYLLLKISFADAALKLSNGDFNKAGKKKHKDKFQKKKRRTGWIRLMMCSKAVLMMATLYKYHSVYIK